VLDELDDGSGSAAAAACAAGQAEVAQVQADYALMQLSSAVRSRLPQLGLVVLTPPRPVHYYALFSRSLGVDVVLSLYPGQRYELECKYTAYGACAVVLRFVCSRSRSTRGDGSLLSGSGVSQWISRRDRCSRGWT